MMKDLSTSAISRIKKNLEDSLEALNLALATRKKLIDYKNYTQKEQALRDSMYDPEAYYHFKLFDKGLSIVQTRDKKYSVRIYNFKPADNYQSFEKWLQFGSQQIVYGEYDSPQAALWLFGQMTKDLIEQTFPKQEDKTCAQTQLAL